MSHCGLGEFFDQAIATGVHYGGSDLFAADKSAGDNESSLTIEDGHFAAKG